MANVSVTTVRLVINNQHKKYRISEQTRQRIQAIIDEYGYFINQTARSLKLNKSHTLGLVVPGITNVFFAALTEKLERLCRTNGFQLITIFTDENDHIEREVIENLYARGVDGLFVCSTTRECQQSLLEHRRGKPVVFLDRDFAVPDISLVSTDHYAGAYQLGQALDKTEDLFFLAGNLHLPSIEARMNGIQNSLSEKGYPLNQNHIFIAQHGSHNNGYALMAQLLQDNQLDQQTVVMASLPILEGAIKCIKKTIGTIPRDLTFASFDDHAMLDFLSNEVITLQQDTTALATNASYIMSCLLANRTPEYRRCLLKPEIITRGRVLT